jgi:TonB-linked SusC/RagA family outer membrane protein
MKKISAFSAAVVCSVAMTYAQSHEVTGTVISSEDGEPVIGASVVVKGTTIGTVTDFDGKFTLNLDGKAHTLVISYIGMAPQELHAKPGMHVVLNPDTQTLDEVVVTGYGVTKKAAFTGSAQTVKGEELTKKADGNFMKSLQGSVAGLQMNNAGGQPGQFASVSLRGTGSINSGTEPLYVIDGIPMFTDKLGTYSAEGSGQLSASPLANINPNDIESINVLKDATATSIYGARAANGVIVITTKKGKTGAPTVNFSGKAGFSKIANLDHNYRLVNLDRYNDIWSDAYYRYIDSKYPGEYASQAEALKDIQESFGYDDNTQSVDWLKQVLRTGVTQEYNVDVQGGKDGLNYFVSGSYFDQEGILINTGMRRYSGRVNLSSTGKVFSWGLQANASVADIKNSQSESQYTNPIVAVYDLRPYEQVYNADGSYNLDAYYNPVAVNDSKLGDKRDQQQIVAIVNPWASIDFGKGFTAKTNIGLNLFELDEFFLWSMMNPQGIQANRQGMKNNDRLFTWTITNTVNWVRSFSEHNINALVGQEAQKQNRRRNYFAAKNYPSNAGSELSNASTPVSAESMKYLSTLASYFGNLNYDFSGKYYLSGSLRYDGSSRFGADNRWGLFYSVGGKYRITQEEFMSASSSWLNNLTLRASYGTVGNQDIGWYDSLGLYEFGYNYDSRPGSAPTQIANPDLKWERAAKFNIGTDLTLFNRLNIEVDFYNEVTKDMIFDVPLSMTTGYATMPMNLGEMRNRGVEALVSLNVFKNRDWSVSFSTNIAHNRNEILRLDTDKPIENSSTIRKVGEPYHTFYMPIYAGVDPDNGKPMWLKGTEGSETTYNYAEAGQRIAGTADPKLTGGFGVNVSYKGIDLGLDFMYKVGGKVYNSGFSYDMQVGHYAFGPVSNYVYENAWRQPGDVTDVPQFNYRDSSGAENTSTRFLMNGSYLRMKNLTLGYTLPKSWVSKAHIGNARVYMTADNLFTVHAADYIGFDPETRADGFQSWAYPVPRTFTFGVNVSF